MHDRVSHTMHYSSKKEQAIDITIIIVSFNTKKLTLECIDSIYKQTPHLHVEIIVVDNASTDGSIEAIEENFPGVIVIASQSNLGFSKANNLALDRSQGRYILLLNPDTVILDFALERMAEYLDRTPAVGIVGPKMFDADYKPWKYETWKLNALNYLFHPLVLRIAGEKQSQEVDWVCGACLMIRRSVIAAIGYLDLFMFGEDMDWCLRTKDAGWKIYHLADAKIIHYWGASAAVPERAAGRVFVTRQSKLYYIKKHDGQLGYYSFAIAVFLEAIARIAILKIQSYYVAADVAKLKLAQIVGFKRLVRAIVAGDVLSKDQKWWEHKN